MPQEKQEFVQSGLDINSGSQVKLVNPLSSLFPTCETGMAFTLYGHQGKETRHKTTDMQQGPFTKS